MNQPLLDFVHQPRRLASSGTACFTFMDKLKALVVQFWVKNPKQIKKT